MKDGTNGLPYALSSLRKVVQSVGRLPGRAWGMVCCDRTLVFLRVDLRQFAASEAGPYEFQVLTADDVRKLPEYNDGWFKQREAIRRLERGCRLFVLKHEERIVYFHWSEVGCAEIRWFDLAFALPEDVTYRTCLYTVPEFRNRGLAHRLGTQLLHYWKEQGKHWVFVVIDPANLASLKLHGDLGFKPYQTVRYRRFLVWRHYCILKSNTGECRTRMACLRMADSIWNAFWACSLSLAGMECILPI